MSAGRAETVAGLPASKSANDLPMKLLEISSPDAGEECGRVGAIAYFVGFALSPVGVTLGRNFGGLRAFVACSNE